MMSDRLDPTDGSQCVKGSTMLGLTGHRLHAESHQEHPQRACVAFNKITPIVH